MSRVACLVLALSLAAPPLALALADAPAAAPEVRLPADPQPRFQHVTLRLDPDKRSYSGRVEVELEVKGRPQAVMFHAEGQRLTRVVLTQGSDTIATERKTGDHGLQTLTLARPLAAGAARLSVEFTHLYGTRAVGLYRVLKAERGYLFTQFEATDGREAFPLWDEPCFKFPYQFTLEIPQDREAVTNTAIERETRTADGFRRLEFARTKPLPSYLLALAVGPLEFTDVPGMRIPTRIVTVQGQKHLAGFAVETTPKLLAALERWFGSPYPYDKLDLIAVPEFAYGAMENAGAITYRDDILLLDPATASAGDRRRHVNTHAHELAHMWYGDLVTMSWWDDLWLNESFADWMASRISDEVYPELKYGLADLQRIQTVKGGDVAASTTAIRSASGTSEAGLTNVGLVYSKGNAVLSMFERYLTPEVFQKGVRAYLKRHAWGNAVAADLWRALDEASGKPVSAAMATFTDQPGVPALRVVPTANGVRITQRRANNAGVTLEPHQWKIPLVLKWSGGRSVRTERLLLDTESRDVKLGAAPQWVLPNGDGRGYFAWSVPDSMLVRLAEVAGSQFTPFERVAFLGNLSMLLRMGEVSGDAYFRALTGFGSDPEPQVLASMLSNLNAARGALVPDDLAEPFARYVRRTLAPTLARIGEQKRPGEDELVSGSRGELLRWLAMRGRDEQVRAFAEREAQRYLADSSAVDPGLVDDVLAIAVSRGDAALFEEMQRRAQAATVPALRRRYLSTLGAFQDPVLERRALDYLLDDAVRPTEGFQIMSGWQGKDEAAGHRLREWMYEHYTPFSQKVPPPALRFAPMMLGGGCTKEAFERMQAFLSDPQRFVSGMDQTMAQTRDMVFDCLGLREREGEAVRRYLEGSGAD